MRVLDSCPSNLGKGLVPGTPPDSRHGTVNQLNWPESGHSKASFCGQGGPMAVDD